MSIASGPVRGIVFDKDGTLFDFRATWEAWVQAFLLRLAHGDHARAAELGWLVDFDFEARAFLPGSVIIAGTPFDIADALEGAVSLPREAFVALLNKEASRAAQFEAVPLQAFLQGLRARGLILGVATNDAESPARAHLRAAGVLDYFDFVAGFDSGYGAKPGPGQLLAFCKATGCAPEHAVMVGDSAHDLLAGQAAGMMRLGVLTGLASAQSLAPLADAVLADIGEIPAWLDRPL